MARLPALPSIDIIRGFKGTVDFYLWRGLACARAWPRWRPTRQSDPSKAAALLFGAIIQAFSLTHGTVLEQLAPETVGIPRTARDLYVSGVFGNLHEASMSDFLDLLTECRDFLSALTALLNALDSIDTDELVVNVDQTVLPPLAATTTGQATMITALQKLDDLQDALQSKHLDRFLVRGMDQLHSFAAVLGKTRTAAISGAGGYLDSLPCAAGQIWHVTNIYSRNATSPTTAHTIELRHDATSYGFSREVKAVPAGERWIWTGHIWLDPTDTVRVWFTGGLIADTCEVIITGEIMTLET